MKTSLKSLFNGTRGAPWVFYSVFLSLTFGSGCALQKKVDVYDSLAPDLTHIVVLGINGLQGALAPVRGQSIEAEGVASTDYEFGGIARLGDYVRIAREKYGQHLLVLNAGDTFQGNLDSSFDLGQTMVQSLNQLGVAASTLGTADLELPKDVLIARLKEASFPTVVSHAVKTKIPVHTSHLTEVGGVSIGLLGVMSLHTPVIAANSDASELFPTHDLKESLLKEAKKLRSEGAQILILMANAGVSCHFRRNGRPLKVGENWPPRWKIETPQDPCLRSTELAQLLNVLPRGTIDGVVAGGGNETVHHWIHGVPVIQGMTEGSSFNQIHFVFDHNRRTLVSGLTQIEGPIGVCDEWFSKQGDCDGRRSAPRAGRGGTTTAHFLGKRPGELGSLQALVEPTLKSAREKSEKGVGNASQTLRRSPIQENELGNFVADAIRARVKADIAVINPGAIPAPIPQGSITLAHLHQAIPRNRALAKLTLSGRQLKNMLRVLTCGSRGFASVSGIRLKLVDLQYAAPSSDMNGDHLIDHWEVDRLLSLRLPNGEKIRDSKLYTVATTDFLAEGGDDLEWTLSQVPTSRIEKIPDARLREVVAEALAKAQTIPSDTAPLIRPADPRLTLTLPPVKPQGRKRRSRKK